MSEDFSKIAEELAIKSASVQDYNRMVKESAPGWLSSLGDYASGAYNAVASNPTMQSIGDYFKKNPMLAKTLAGAGIGGALGGASSLFSRNDERNVPRSILHGALAGGGVGLGAGLIGRYGGDSLNNGLNYVRKQLGMPVSGAINAARGPKADEILGAINSYQTPKFTEGLAGAYLNPYVAGAATFDAGTNLLGALAASGRNGRLNTQEPVLKALYDKIVQDPKVLGGESLGKAFTASMAGEAGPKTDVLRKILAGTPHEVSYIDKALAPLGSLDPTKKGPGGRLMTSTIDKSQLSGLMQDIPGARHYNGGIGALGNLMERAGGGAQDGRLGAIKRWLSRTGASLQGASNGVGLSTSTPSRLARLLSFREHASPMFGVSGRNRALARLGMYGGLPLVGHTIMKMREAGANKQNLLKLLEAYKNAGGNANQISPEVMQAINGAI